MKQGKIFWGVFFVALGLLGLLASFHVYFFVDVDSDWVIPLLLVLLGLTFILKQNSFKITVIALAALISAFAVFSFFWDDDASGSSLFKTRITFSNDDDDEELLSDDSINAETVPYYELENMRVKLLTAASELHLSGVSTNEFTARFNGRRYDMDFNNNALTNSATLKIVHQRGESNGLSLKKLTVELNDKPEYSFVIKSGASDLNLDLSDLNVKKIKGEFAATDAEMRFGDKQKVLNADLTFAASQLTLYLPKDAGCLVNSSFALVDDSFPGFIAEDENTMVTKNYSSAEKKIVINLKGALGDFEIKFY